MDRDWLRTVLEHARGLVLQGWTQGNFTRGYGRMQTWCMWGAIVRANAVVRGARITKTEERDIEMVFRHRTRGSIIDFNDAPRRTQGEVVAAFDAVLASLSEPAPERLLSDAPEQVPVVVSAG